MIEHVARGTLIKADHQNQIINQVNQNTDDIAVLQGSSGGDPGAVQDLIDASITTHVNAPTPHPAYDDIQSLTILFENGLV